MIVTVNDFSIGGFEPHSPQSLFMSTNGSNTGTLRLNGISGSVSAGTAAFDSSTVAHLAVSGNGVFTNAGSSTLVIDRISVSGNGFPRNLTNPSGRMDLGVGQHQIGDPGKMDNTGILQLSGTLTLRNNSKVLNYSSGDFSNSGGQFFIANTNKFENKGSFTHSAGLMQTTSAGQLLNSDTFSITGGNRLLLGTTQSLNTDNFAQTSGNTDIGSGFFVNSNTFNNIGNYNHNGSTTNINNGAILLNDFFYTHNDGALTVHAGGQFTNGLINTFNYGTVQVSAGGTLSGTGSTSLNGGRWSSPA